MISPRVQRSIWSRGYTLPQLLVVFAIIGSLSTILLFATAEHRKSGRDARRIDDLAKISLALELYHDTNGMYPPTVCSATGLYGWDCTGWINSNNAAEWNYLSTLLLPHLGRPLPVDPVNSCDPTSDNCYSYMYGNVYRDTASHQFDLVGQLENKKSPLRCEVKQYRWGLNNSTLWCGAWSKYIYEVSD